MQNSFQKIANIRSINILTNKNARSILNTIHCKLNTRKPIKNSQTVLAAPRTIDRLSHTYTQIHTENG